MASLDTTHCQIMVAQPLAGAVHAQGPPTVRARPNSGHSRRAITARRPDEDQRSRNPQVIGFRRCCPKCDIRDPRRATATRCITASRRGCHLNAIDPSPKRHIGPMACHAALRLVQVPAPFRRADLRCPADAGHYQLILVIVPVRSGVRNSRTRLRLSHRKKSQRYRLDR
jgi:hypothetical protein